MVKDEAFQESEANSKENNQIEILEEKNQNYIFVIVVILRSFSSSFMKNRIFFV